MYPFTIGARWQMYSYTNGLNTHIQLESSTNVYLVRPIHVQAWEISQMDKVI